MRRTPSLCGETVTLETTKGTPRFRFSRSSTTSSHIPSRDLEERNQKLRQEMLRTQAMLRLSRKLFKVTRRGKKPGPKPGRPRKTLPPLKIEEQPAIVPSPKD
jgi:hypothetical protein